MEVPIDPELAAIAAASDRGPGRRAEVAGQVRRRAPLLDPEALDREVDRVLWQVEGLGPLQVLLDDPANSEVMVNGDGRVWVESAGVLRLTPLVLTAATTLHVIERVIAPLGLRLDRSSPVADARLPDGSRVNAVVPPVAIDGPVLTIRRFGAAAIPLASFARPAVVELLVGAVHARRNLVVSGGTGSGKTTCLNALAAAMPPQDRIVTIEDAAELRLPGDHVVRLEARPANPDGGGAIRIRDLVRNALRMRPDRIVVGEVRGGEALDMLQAMNTGHEGSVSTCHANSATDALHRIETMILMGDVGLPPLAIRTQLASALDAVVHVGRVGDGRREIVEVVEVVPRLRDGALRIRVLATGDAVVADWSRPAPRTGGGSGS